MDRWLHLICHELNSLIPPRSVRDHSRATDLIERDRHIDATPFLWTFLAGTAHSDDSVSDVHDLYKVFTGDDVAYSSIQQWITPELTDLLSDLVDYVSVELGRTESLLGGRYGRFRDVFIPDATICTLSPDSIRDFPGFGDDHAGAKLHVVESLVSVAPVLDSITSARIQETTQFEIDDWVEDSLTMFDLGYLDYNRLGHINDNDGWFVCRLNADANPHVSEEPARCAGTQSIWRAYTSKRCCPTSTDRLSTSQQRPVRIRTIRTSPTTFESSVFATRTTKMPLSIGRTSTPTTSTTSTRRIFPERRSRRENSRRCTAIDGASRLSFKNSRRTSDWR